jgi:hypothetical protein
MGFMEELEERRKQGFTAEMKSGWEADLETAYQDMRSYLLLQASDIVRMHNYERNEKPISTESYATPASVKLLSDKAIVLLAQKLSDDGLDVKMKRVQALLVIDVKLPPLPKFFGREIAKKVSQE